MHYKKLSRKLMLGDTLDGEFKLLPIRELDNDNLSSDYLPHS